MNMFEVMAALDIDNATEFIRRISLKILMHYAPEVEISNFDEADIARFIKNG